MNAETQAPLVKYELKNQTAVITINRPEVYNALNASGKVEIIKALREAQKNPQVRSIILTGEGKAFCTGQDLNDRSVQAKHGTVDLGMTLETEWNPLMMAIREANKIVIAAVNGVCAGAGLSVALSCDLVVVKNQTKFVGAFSKLGLAPDAGSTYLFTRALGAKKTTAFFLYGESLTGEELEKAGLVNEVCENPLDKAMELAEKINKLAPQSVTMIKKNILSSLDSTYGESMERETNVQRYLGRSNDYKEGLNAFLEKRNPIFNGH